MTLGFVVRAIKSQAKTLAKEPPSKRTLFRYAGIVGSLGVIGALVYTYIKVESDRTSFEEAQTLIKSRNQRMLQDSSLTNRHDQTA